MYLKLLGLYISFSQVVRAHKEISFAILQFINFYLFTDMYDLSIINNKFINFVVDLKIQGKLKPKKCTLGKKRNF